MRVEKGFQPIQLKICDESSSCACGDISCSQLALTTDKFSFQLQNDVNFLSEDVILNGDFATSDLTNWTDDGSGNAWSGATDAACVQADSGILWQDQEMNICECYRLVFDLKSDLPESCFLSILAYNGSDWVTLEQYSDIDATDDIVLVICPDVAYTRIGFQFTQTGTACDEAVLCIDNIELRNYAVTINIYNCCTDTLIDTVENCDIQFTETHVLVSGLWSDYVSAKGCYKFCIDDFELVLNYTFELDISDWTQTGTGEAFTWNAGRIEVALTALSINSQIIEQEVDLPVCDYSLIVDIDGSDYDFEVYINDTLETTITAIGTTTISISKDYVITKIGFKFINNGGNITDTINFISIVKDLCSNCICIADSHPFCTNILTSRHSEDTTEWDFESDTDFKFFLRLYSRKINPRYPTEEELYLSSAGVNTLNYSRNEKIWEFQIERVPEYIWDAIQDMFSFDELTIAGIRYVKVEGDIDPNWKRGNTKLASGSIEIKKGTDNRVSN